MSEQDTNRSLPKSIRHKQILEVAAEHPDASLDALADEIPSATPDLVEHVLAEYGDPTAEDTVEPSGDDTGDEPSEPDPADPDDTHVEATDETRQQGPDEHPSPEDLSEKQQRTLRAIAENPSGTQAEIAEQLDVSAPTVSNRVNDVDGFEWQDRRSFVESIFEDVGPTATDESTITDSSMADETGLKPARSAPDGGTVTESQPIDSATDGGEPHIETLQQRLTELERTVDALADADPGSGSTCFDDPELLQKTIHACMDSEVITQDEELRILEAIVSPGTTSESKG